MCHQDCLAVPKDFFQVLEYRILIPFVNLLFSSFSYVGPNLVRSCLFISMMVS